MSIAGKMSKFIDESETIPSNSIKAAMTATVTGRRSASWTIHIRWAPVYSRTTLGRLALPGRERADECAIRIRQQVQELDLSEIANQLETRERRVVHANPPEVRELEPHEMAQDGADDIAVRDEQDAPAKIGRAHV